jgi:hypothetical protein
MTKADWVALFIWIGCVTAGAILAEYAPIFSDPITANLCQPFSPCRNSAVVGYVVGGALLGLILGMIMGGQVAQHAASRTPYK